MTGNERHGAVPSGWSGRGTPLLLAGALLLGLVLRLHGIGARTIGHAEFHTPGLDYPAYVTHPVSRLTPSEVVEAPFLIHHPHLPGWELFMLGWNRVSGTDAALMRLSSVLFGVFALLGLFLFGSQTSGRGSALLATVLLAFHGYHILWSQHLRPWVFLSFLGIASVVLLIRLAERMRAADAVAYVALCTVGLWSDFYFWPVMAAQMLWILLRSSGSPSDNAPTTDAARLSPVFAVQWIALLLASPTALYFLRFSGQASPVEGPIWPSIRFMLQLVGLVRTNWFDGAVVIPPALSTVLAVAGGLILIAGATSHDRPPARPAGGRPRRSMLVSLGVAQVAACAVAVLFARLAFGSVYQGRKLLVAVQLLPFGMLVGLGVLYGTYRRVAPALRRLLLVPAIGRMLEDLPVVVALGPVAILAAIHTSKGVLAPYALVSLAPFYMLLASRGILRAGPRLRTAGVVAMLGVCLYSVVDYGTTANSPRDYRALANALIPRTRPGDVFVVENEWWIVPIHFYLPPDRFDLVPSAELRARVQAASEAGKLPPPRVWVVDFGEEPALLERRLAKTVAELPSGYVPSERAAAGKGQALLLQLDRQ